MARTVTKGTKKLDIVISGELGYRETGVEFRSTVVGAFDVTIDFADFNVIAAGADEGWVGIRFKISDSDYAEIKRIEYGDNGQYLAQIMLEGTLSTLSVPSFAESGTLRIVRTGMIVTCYYYDSAWVALLSKTTFSTEPGKLSVLGGAFTNVTLNVSVRNFIYKESPNSLYEGHMVQEDEKTPKLKVTRRGHRDYKNKILVQYVPRDREYNAGTASADDLPDIDNYGLLDQTMNIDGYCKLSRAAKMAWLFLRKSLMQPEDYAAMLGPRSIGMCPGDIIFVSDKTAEASNIPARVMAIGEKENYAISVELREEKDLYELRTYGGDSISPSIPNNYQIRALSVVDLLAIELPPQFSGNELKIGVTYSRPLGNDSWAGASLYRGYTPTGDQERLANTTASGATGIVRTLGWKDDDTAYVTLELAYDDVLTSQSGVDALFASPSINQCMAIINGIPKHFRFATAELSGERTWMLSDLIWDLTNFAQLNTFGDLPISGEVYIGYAFKQTLPNVDANRTLYISTPSFNFQSTAQDLSEAASTELTTVSLYHKPMPPWGVVINDELGIDSSGYVIVAAGDITIDWRSINRFCDGFYVYDRADAPYDDLDFNTFELTVYDTNTMTLRRTISQTGKVFIYTNAMQSSDGGPFTDYTFKLRQKGSWAYSDYKQFQVFTV